MSDTFPPACAQHPEYFCAQKDKSGRMNCTGPVQCKTGAATGSITTPGRKYWRVKEDRSACVYEAGGTTGDGAAVTEEDCVHKFVGARRCDPSTPCPDSSSVCCAQSQANEGICVTSPFSQHNLLLDTLACEGFAAAHTGSAASRRDSALPVPCNADNAAQACALKDADGAAPKNAVSLCCVDPKSGAGVCAIRTPKEVESLDQRTAACAAVSSSFVDAAAYQTSKPWTAEGLACIKTRTPGTYSTEAECYASMPPVYYFSATKSTCLKLAKHPRDKLPSPNPDNVFGGTPVFLTDNQCVKENAAQLKRCGLTAPCSVDYCCATSAQEAMDNRGACLYWSGGVMNNVPAHNALCQQLLPGTQSIKTFAECKTAKDCAFGKNDGHTGVCCVDAVTGLGGRCIYMEDGKLLSTGRDAACSSEFGAMSMRVDSTAFRPRPKEWRRDSVTGACTKVLGGSGEYASFADCYSAALDTGISKAPAAGQTGAALTKDNRVLVKKSAKTYDASWQPAPTSLPTGTVVYLAGPATGVPNGYLECNGARVNKTTYAALWNVIKARYGQDDSTTFVVPDLRGVFLRGVDGGRGLDAGRGLGSFQEDSIKSHTHNAGVANSSSNDIGGQGWTTTNQAVNAYRTSDRGVGAWRDNVNLATGTPDTRPKNVSIRAFIKT
jgi:microcystin-dependent protein